VPDQYSLRVHVEEVENGQFLATPDDMPGLVAQGRTTEEATEIAHDLAGRLLESYHEHGDPFPDAACGASVPAPISISQSPRDGAPFRLFVPRDNTKGFANSGSGLI